MPTIRLAADLQNLERLVQFVSSFARKQGFDPKRLQEIELGTEEALVNIFKYAYPGDPTGAVEVNCEYEKQTGLVITLTDSGIPFDIESLPPPKLSADITDRPIGGLGVYLIHKMMDDIRYRRDGNKNILTLFVKKRR